MEGKKTKFNYDEYTAKNDLNKPWTETINVRNSYRVCICNNFNESKCFECFKCKEKIHNCVKVQINRPQIHSFECLSCLARTMDLVYQPKSILLETFYKTENIFEKSNVIHFEFNLKFEQTKLPIDVRGFKGSKIELVWPMQGQFYFNYSQKPNFVLRPLKSNSNRKNRAEEHFMISPELLKEGKNVLTFKIPRISKISQKGNFVEKFQYEEIGVYFIGIYSVKELQVQQILSLTQKQRRHEKQKTLSLFKQGNQGGEMDIPKQKIKLIDPYTCERIRFPVRGKYCLHLSPVCLMTYLQFQKKSRQWRCPICSKDSNSFMNEPYLDMWMYELLKENPKGESVFIYENGLHEWDKVQEVQNLDSDDEESSPVNKCQNENIELIEMEDPIIQQMQNFDLESHQNSNRLNTQQQVNLIDYQDDDIQFVEPSFPSRASELVQQESNYEPQLSQIQQIELEEIDPERGNQRMLDYLEPREMKLEPVNQSIIEERSQKSKLRGQSDSESDFEFPFNNDKDFVSTNPVIKIKITKNDDIEKKEKKIPEIYKTALEKKPQQNVQKGIPLHLLNQFKERVINFSQKKQKNSQLNFSQHSGSDKQIQSGRTQKPIKRNQSSSRINEEKLKKNTQQTKKEKTIANKIEPKKQPVVGKRLISRPTFIDQVEMIKQLTTEPVQQTKTQSLSFGKVIKKNIELSQGKPVKQDMKFEPVNVKLSASIVNIPGKKPGRQDKQQENQVPVLKLKVIDHAKFVRDYCKIPINPLVKKMPEDIKRLFKSIL